VRQLHDLSWQGRTATLRLLVRKFICINAACDRSIFCERMPELTASHARTTNRLTAAHRTLGFALGGEAGSRVAERLSIPTSPDTLLRRIKQQKDQPGVAPRVIGIDDWAWRKGQKYGTIVIDLERGRVIDLLPGRDGTALEAWLKEHPEIEVISRDRWALYAQAASHGAPQAKQVADRWHLLKNLREAVERLLERRSRQIRQSLKPLIGCTEKETESAAASAFDAPLSPPQPRPLTAREEAGEAKRQHRIERFDQVHELHQQGKSMREIAVALDLDRETVARYVSADSCPERKPSHPRRAGVNGYRDYIDRRLNEGCDNAAELHRELTAQGFDVSYYAVRRFVRRCLIATGRQRKHSNSTTAPVARVPSSKELSFTVIRKPEERDAQEQARFDLLKGVDHELASALDLAIQFAAMLRGLLTQPLVAWLTKADASCCPELRSLARSLRQDDAAVQAAMNEPWSNGPVEGQVNRLKMIKRQMYGRASFKLLRARVLAAA
jgi:transposase